MPYAHPTVEHYTPLFVTLGAATDPEEPGRAGHRRLLDGPVEAVAPGRLTRPVSSSSSTRSSAVGSHRSAAALARTWSPRVAPEITDPTAGWAARPAIATSRSVRSRSSAYDVSASMRSHSASRSHCERSGSSAAPGARRRRLAAVVLAGQQAVLEREVRQQPDAERLARRHHLVLDGPVEQRVAVLRRHEPLQPRRPRRPVGVGDLPGGEVRGADVAHLARAYQVGERRQRLLDRRHVVGHVQLVQVDVVGPQPAQAALDRRHDRATGSPAPDRPAAVRRRTSSPPRTRRAAPPGRSPASPRWRRA